MRLSSKFEKLCLTFHRVWTLVLVAASIAAISVLLLTSCDHRGGVVRQARAALPHAEVKLNVTLLKEGTPPKVSTELHWFGDMQPYQWAIHRKRDDEWFSAAIVGKVRGDQHAFRDRNVEPGHSYTYYLSALGQSGDTHIAKATVAVGAPVPRITHQGLRLRDVK